MQFVVKFACIAAIFVFASCHSDVPGLPNSYEIKFCRYKDKDGVSQCKSTYEISEADCKALRDKGEAKLYSNKDCTVEE